MSEFDDILSTSFDDLPPEVATPKGTWRLKCRGVGFVPAKEEGQSPKILLTHTPVEPMDNVSESELQACAEAGVDPKDNEITTSLFMSKPKDWHRLKRIMEAHGVEVSDYSNKRKAIEALKGRDVLANVSRRTYTSGGEERSEDAASGWATVDGD